MLQAASSATRRSGRRNRSRKMPSAVTASVSNGLIKERACFVAEFFAAQARSSGGIQFRHGEQLYSQVAAVKTVNIRIKSLETTMREMKRLLDILDLRTDGSY